ncbi:TPA: ShlB/FhaC/HecB family hemolysin secretion/activation protein, partial [Burkholderia multivorans]|nr:ShlB/FhaC/HecB family hemolysin secretion/activation protein [Burkholderia multivorans]
MRIRSSVVLLSIASFVPMTGYTQQAPSPADQAAAARANAEQDRQAQQQREAQQRETVVRAPSVRSDVPRIEAYPALPIETPCFRIDRFTLDVPNSLPDAARVQGASALPMDRFSFAREWLEHYAGQCVGK